MESFEIGDRTVGPGAPTYIIAEAGLNHNGSLDRARRMIATAAEAGVDAVKFQTWRADKVLVEQDEPSERYEQIRSLEMPYEWIPKLAGTCAEHDVDFLSTPFDAESAAELADYVPAFKIASFTLTHIPLLRDLAEFDLPVVLSTGAHEFDEIRDVVSTLAEIDYPPYALLHCVSSYPTPLESINVRAVERLHERFDVPVGLSDHTIQPTVAPAASVALGGSIVEKHFTLDSSLEGPDHDFSLEPDELTAMVEAIRDTERALGSGEIGTLDIERDAKEGVRRGLQANHSIAAGETLDRDAVAIRRPGEFERGLNPKYVDEVVGRTTTRAIETGGPITWDDLEGPAPDE